MVFPEGPARRFKTTAGMTSRFHLLQQRGQTLENSRNLTKILKIAIFQGSDPAFQSIILGIHVSFQGCSENAQLLDRFFQPKMMVPSAMANFQPKTPIAPTQTSLQT